MSYWQYLAITKKGRQADSKVKQYIEQTNENLRQKLMIKDLGEEYEDISQLTSFIPFAKSSQEDQILSFTND